MAKHKSKLERFRNICGAVFFADEKGIKPVPYQVAKEINYPQSHTTSYMNELARKKILIKDKNGLYSLPNFRSLSDFEKIDAKLQLSKYYSWKIIDTIRKGFGNVDIRPKTSKKVSYSEPERSVTEKQHNKLKKEKETLDEEISYILDMIDEFPLSFFVISKKDLLKWMEKEILKMRHAKDHEQLNAVRFSMDLVIRILQDSAKAAK